MVNICLKAYTAKNKGEQTNEEGNICNNKTKNKVREVNMMMKDFDVELQTMGEAGINIDIVEDGKP